MLSESTQSGKRIPANFSILRQKLRTTGLAGGPHSKICSREVHMFRILLVVIAEHILCRIVQLLFQSLRVSDLLHTVTGERQRAKSVPGPGWFYKSLGLEATV